MVEVKLVVDHTHSRVLCKAGSTISVNNSTADWLVSAGVAERVTQGHNTSYEVRKPHREIRASLHEPPVVVPEGATTPVSG